MYKVKAIVFDFDGTIVDSMGKLADLAADIMSKRYDMTWEHARERYVETSGIPFHEQLEVIFPEDARNKETAAQFENSKKVWYKNSPLFTDTKNTLVNLKNRGYKVAVSSNNFQEMVDTLVDKYNLTLDIKLGWRSPEFAKGKAHFEYITKKLSCKSEDIVFVGDSLKDGDRAETNGVKFIAKEGLFTEKQFKSQFPTSHVVKNLTDLEKIL